LSRDWAYALAIQKDGGVVAGGFSRAPGVQNLALSRYTRSGRLDVNFGRGGRVLSPFASGPVRAVAIQRDGKIVAAGGWLRRYTHRGSLDRSFGRRGIVRGSAGFAVAIQRDGKIVAAGVSGPFLAVARYARNGRLDPSFGHGCKALTHGYAATGAAIQPDGKIVVTALGSRIIRCTSRGELDQSFGTGGVVRTTISTLALALQTDSKIVVAGGGVGPTDSGDVAVARYTTDGRLDTSFGDGGTTLANFGADPEGNNEGSSEWASAVAIQADGKIVAAGSTDVRGVRCGGAIGSICDDFALARFNADGTLDTTFGKGGKVVTGFLNRLGSAASSSNAEAVGIQADGKVVAAGLGNGYDFALARYNTSGRLDGTFGRRGKVLTDFGSG
jgi:uncharacterized delta-60 repeat protein